MNLKFVRPTLQHRELITNYFRRYPSSSCDRVFGNTYLWSPVYDSGFAIVEDTLIFQDRDGDEVSYSYPAGEKSKVKKAIETLWTYQRSQGKELVFHGVTRPFKEELEEMFPGCFAFKVCRDQADYVYDRESLVTLSGKKLHSRRNHWNKFRKTYNYTYMPLTKENQMACLEMAKEWAQEKEVLPSSFQASEMKVTEKAIVEGAQIGLSGGVLMVDDKVVAFAIGEELNKDMMVVHIEKALLAYDGAYAMINQQFAKYQCEGYSYINREDDAGELGLRKVKLSYRPTFLVEKGTATLLKK